MDSSNQSHLSNTCCTGFTPVASFFDLVTTGATHIYAKW